MSQLCVPGDRRYVDGDVRGAVAAYTDALRSSGAGGASPEERGACLLGRSGAFLQLGMHEDAVQDALDAQQAVAHSFVAHFRQGQAAFHLGELEAALAAFEAAEAAAGFGAGNGEARRTRAREWTQKVRKTRASAGDDDELADLAAADAGPRAAAAAAATTAVRGAAAAKRRRQCTLSHYHTRRAVKVTIHAAGVTPEQVAYHFAEDEVGVKIERATDVYSLRFVPAGSVRSSQCTCTIKPDAGGGTVVLRLVKADPADDWNGALVAARKPRSVRAEETEEEQRRRQATGDGGAAAGGGGASSLPNPYSRARDWDKVDKALEEELERDKPKDEGALNSWFQQIYARGSKDTRRAMDKSMQTSNFTVLSTNWDEVSGKDYEGKDRVVPEGMELRKWEK